MIDSYNLILSRARSPKNKKIISTATHQAQGHHAVCGDLIKVFLEIEESLINEVTFDGDGCALCIASASLMTEHVKNLTTDQALALFDDFHSLVTVDLANKRLEKFQAFALVKEFPKSAKCVTLPWHTLKSAINENPSVSM